MSANKMLKLHTNEEDVDYLMQIRVRKQMFAHEQRRVQLKKILKMVTSIDESAPECKKRRSDVQSESSHNEQQTGEQATSKSEDLKEDLSLEHQDQRQPSKPEPNKNGKELLNEEQSESELIIAKPKLRQSKFAQYEKVLAWMNNNEYSTRYHGESILLSNSSSKQEMAKFLHDTPAPGASTVLYDGPSENRCLISKHDMRHIDIEFGLIDSDFGRTNSEFTTTESDLTQTESDLTHTESEIAPTESELTATESETVQSQPDSARMESDIELGYSVSDVEETNKTLGLDQLTGTPEMTSDSSGQDTFYSCESQLQK